MQLNSNETDTLIKIIRKYFLNVYKMIFVLDQVQADIFKQKNTYYYNQLKELNHHDHSHDNQSGGCCTSFFSKVYIPENQRSGLEQLIFEQFRPSSVKDNLPQLLDYLQIKYFRIKNSGQKDKLNWTQDVQGYVLSEVLREGVQIFFQNEIKKSLQKSQYIDSKQPMLLATPRTWELKHPKIPLDFLKQDFMKSLMERGYGVQCSFTQNKSFARAFFKECDYLERDGRFEEPLQEQNIRQDKVLQVSLSEIEQKNFKNIFFIANIMSSFPYEMNVKSQIFALISESFQISYFNNLRQIHQLHYDSSYDKKLDTGKKVSFLYITIDPDQESEHGNQDFIELQISDKEKIQINLEQDMLIGLMSRKVPYSINTSGSRLFIMRFWIDGPYDNKSNY